MSPWSFTVYLTHHMSDWAGAAPHPGAEAAWLPPTRRAATHPGTSLRVRGFGVPGDQNVCGAVSDPTRTCPGRTQLASLRAKVDKFTIKLGKFAQVFRGPRTVGKFATKVGKFTTKLDKFVTFA